MKHLRKPLIIYAALLAAIAEPAWIAYKLFNPSVYGSDPDALDYLSMANGRFVAISPIHRYRLIIPGLVHVLPFNHHAGFFVVNAAFTALAAALLLALLLTYVPIECALIGLLPFLMSRDVVAAAGMPMVDSLLFATIAAAFYAIRTKSRSIAIAVLLLGPIVKENFVFLIPLLIAFGPIRKGRAIALVAAGLALAASIRLSTDAAVGTSQSYALLRDLSHVTFVWETLRRLATLHGMATLWMAFGPFWIALIAGLAYEQIDAPLLWWLPLVGIQMLLSGGQLSRMAVMAFPTVAVATSLLMASAIRQIFERQPRAVIGDDPRYLLYPGETRKKQGAALTLPFRD